VPLSEDLDRLDTAIRQLQMKWDTFFSGAERKPPTELQAQVEALVKRYANAEIRNSGERFRYQSLTARFSTFNELWQKRLRAREEGKVFGQHGLRAEALPPKPVAPPPAVARPSQGEPPREYRIGNPAADQEAIRGLYERFVAERQRAGGGAAPPFDSFRQLVASQTDRILREKGAAAVDFRLETKDGKVTLKARVVR
jgi:hypothetical protein